MSGFWIQLARGAAGYAEGATIEEAALNVIERRGLAPKRDAEGKVVGGPLPYPAKPILFQIGDCPPFCYSPTQCVGKTACPKSHACSE